MDSMFLCPERNLVFIGSNWFLRVPLDQSYLDNFQTNKVMGDSRAMGTYKPFAKLSQFMEQIVGKSDSSLDSPTLHRFASDGNEDELIGLINNGSDVNEEDTEGFTALYHAADNGHAKIIEILLQNGAHVDGKPNPLHVVRDLKSAQLLFHAKADLNALDEFGNSPLHTAIRKGKHEIVTYFFSVGADIFCTNVKGETPLHTLCSSFMKKPHEENLTRKLIEMGANHSKDSQGRSPLHLAVMNYCLEKSKTVEILVKAGASVTDVDLQGMNPIHHFLEKCRAYFEDYNELFYEYIDLLVINESAANSKNAIGQTLLHLAILAEAPLQVLEYLVQKGSSSTTEDGQKRSLLHCIVERDGLDDAVEILDFLLDEGLNINGPDIWGQTVLHYAVDKNKKKLVKALVERGADVNVRDSVGRQPLHVAAERGWDEICDFLIKIGANINAQDKYQSTPLHFAAWSNKAHVAHVLIEAGCDVELRDACGQTAEEVANFWSSFDFLQIMHEKDGNNNLELKQKLLAKYGGELLQLKTFQDLIESSEESLRSSSTLNEFLRCLISTPGMGTVFEDPEAGEIREVLGKFATNIAKRITDNHPKMRCTLYTAGSSSEGTKTKYPDEFDFVVCFDELSENIYPEHKTEDVLESVQLVPDTKETNEKVKEVLEEGVDYEETSASVSNYTRIVLKDHTSYEYSEFTTLEPKTISNYMMFNLFAQQLSNIVFDESFPKDERLVIKDVTNDPKLSLLWKGSRYKTLAIEVDFVPAVRLPRWPDKFRIQSQLLGPDLLQLPCLAVPKMTSQQDDNLWRVSLCLVETAIMKKCLHRMRNSYIAAKSLINSAICPLVSFDDYEEAKMQYKSLHDSVSSDEEFELYEQVESMLPSYLLKMAFFYSLEEKVAKDKVETVFDVYETHRSDKASDIATNKEPDPQIVKDVFRKCDAWLSNHFVPSFFNPRQNVMGSGMLEENGVKAKMFIKYILKLLNEKY